MRNPLLSSNRHQLVCAGEVIKEWIAGYPTLEALEQAHDEAVEAFIADFVLEPPPELKQDTTVYVINHDGDIIYPEHNPNIDYE